MYSIRDVKWMAFAQIRVEVKLVLHQVWDVYVYQILLNVLQL